MIEDDYLVLKEALDILPCHIERIRILIKKGELPLYVCTKGHFDKARGLIARGEIAEYCKANLPIICEDNNLYFSKFDLFDKNGEVLVKTSGIHMWSEIHSDIRFKKEDVYLLLDQFSLENKKPTVEEINAKTEIAQNIEEQRPQRPEKNQTTEHTRPPQLDRKGKTGSLATIIDIALQDYKVKNGKPSKTVEGLMDFVKTILTCGCPEYMDDVSKFGNTGEKFLLLKSRNGKWYTKAHINRIYKERKKSAEIKSLLEKSPE